MFRGSLFSTSPSAPSACLFDNSHPARSKVASSCGLDVHVHGPLSCSVSHLYRSSLEKCPSGSLAHLLVVLLRWWLFSLWSGTILFCILDIRPLAYTDAFTLMLWNDYKVEPTRSPPFCRWPFLWLCCGCLFVVSPTCCYCFWCYKQKAIGKTIWKRFFLVFPPCPAGILWPSVLCLSLYFEFIFTDGVK